MVTGMHIVSYIAIHPHIKWSCMVWFKITTVIKNALNISGLPIPPHCQQSADFTTVQPPIHISTTPKPPLDVRLPLDILPTHYDVELKPDIYQVRSRSSKLVLGYMSSISNSILFYFPVTSQFCQCTICKLTTKLN